MSSEQQEAQDAPPVSKLVGGGCLGAVGFFIIASVVGGFIGGVLGVDRGTGGQVVLAFINFASIIFGAWIGVQRTKKKHKEAAP